MWKRFSQATQLCHGCDLAVEWCTAGHWASGVIWARLAVVAPSELKSLQFGWNPSRIYIYIYISESIEFYDTWNTNLQKEMRNILSKKAYTLIPSQSGSRLSVVILRPGCFQQYAIGWMPGMSLSGQGYPHVSFGAVAVTFHTFHQPLLSP